MHYWSSQPRENVITATLRIRLRSLLVLDRTTAKQVCEMSPINTYREPMLELLEVGVELNEIDTHGKGTHE